ncbi:MAG: hypothetical protein DAHOPDDO_03366 [Ignavibacteriaceae bacterium]|nr:hypothetical protein [Ignavibacteriaceae bacterium]
MEETKSPKIFISYSWSSKEHEGKVLELAESLIGNGIEVVLDKWELPEGEDKFKFMERSVNDPSIDKIIIISDKKYAEKADNREGGVGTETQIISPKLYEQFKEEEQKSRFVALVFENDEKSNPYLPTYYKSRIYIDFSSEEARSENFEQLIRWIFNKPLFVKPELGKPPFYITSDEHISLNTQAKLKTYNDALHSNIKNAKGALADYLETFSNNLRKFKMEFESVDNYYDKVVENIKQFIPYRDEFVDVTISALKYLDDETIAAVFHKFFEDILSYKIVFIDTKFKDRMEFDNYQFIINELFLYFTAAILKQYRFELFDTFLNIKYYIGNARDTQDTVYSYIILYGVPRSFEIASTKNRRISYTSDILIGNANNKKILLTDIMQADFILFLRSDITFNQNLRRWHMNTGVYIASRQPDFELFLRSESKSFFGKFRQCLGIDNLESLKTISEEFRNGKRRSFEYYGDTLYPPALMNLEKLCKSN